MKPLRSFRVQPGQTAGRVSISLRSSDNRFTAWLTPQQAERLATMLLQVRFALPPIVVVAPKRKRKGKVYVQFTGEPKPQRYRPTYSDPLLKRADQVDKEVRPRVREAQDKWDRRRQRRIAKYGKPARTSGFLSRGKSNSERPGKGSD
jgi:hypothetical protein